MDFISDKKNIDIPKYKQIVHSVEKALLDHILIKGDKLPSINSIRNKNSVSRDTILLAFNELKIRGIVQSVAGKGYYIKSENIDIKQKVFLLFDELNSFKEDLYKSFLKNLDKNIEVDIYFHHFNPDVFSKLIYDSLEMENVNGHIDINDQTVFLRNFSMNILEGEMVMTGLYSSKIPDEPKVDFDLNMKNLDIQKSYEAFDIMETYLPVAAKTSGAFSTKMSFQSTLD
ncbi:MAG: hypothetical protein DRJ07_14275, partial [Bacteroidetes bacterium]